MGFLQDLLGAKKPPKFNANRVRTSEEVEDVLTAVGKVGEFNAGSGIETAAQLTATSNSAITDQVVSALDTLFSGELTSLQSIVAGNLRDRLGGRLSEGTRRVLGSRAAETGAHLGRSAVEDRFTLALGTTAEQVSTQATQQFQSLYATYRQSLPLTSPVEALEFTGINAPAAVQASLAGAQLQLDRDRLRHQAQVARSQSRGMAGALSDFAFNAIGASLGPAGLGGAISQVGLPRAISSGVQGVFGGFSETGLRNRTALPAIPV